MPTEPATAAAPAAEPAEEPEAVPEVPDTAAAEAPALPEGWEAVTSKSTGDTYYLNTVRPTRSPPSDTLS